MVESARSGPASGPESNCDGERNEARRAETKALARRPSRRCLRRSPSGRWRECGRRRCQRDRRRRCRNRPRGTCRHAPITGDDQQTVAGKKLGLNLEVVTGTRRPRAFGSRLEFEGADRVDRGRAALLDLVPAGLAPAADVGEHEVPARPPWASSKAQVTVPSRYSPIGTVASAPSPVRPTAEPSRPMSVAVSSTAAGSPGRFAHGRDGRCRCPSSGSTERRCPNGSERTAYRASPIVRIDANRNCSDDESQQAIVIQVDPEAVLGVGEEPVAVAVGMRRTACRLAGEIDLAFEIARRGVAEGDPGGPEAKDGRPVRHSEWSRLRRSPGRAGARQVRFSPSTRSVASIRRLRLAST